MYKTLSTVPTITHIMKERNEGREGGKKGGREKGRKEGRKGYFCYCIAEIF
jgi:hypothetical protein